MNQHRKPSIACALLAWLIVTPSQAARLGLSWEFARAYTPPPDAFILTITQGGAAQQQFRIKLAAEGVCTPLGPDSSRETFCTIVACPAPESVVAYWVQAEWKETRSAASNLVTCWFKPGEPGCLCHDPAEAVPQLPPPPRPALAAELPPPMDPTPLALDPTPPPLPQQSADDLQLAPLGVLAAVAVVPAIPAMGGG